jgi:threonine dehydratase
MKIAVIVKDAQKTCSDEHVCSTLLATFARKYNVCEACSAVPLYKSLKGIIRLVLSLKLINLK